MTKKVLNDCLRKNVEFGILERKAYPEIPPRVEYGFTPFGRKFVRVLDDLERLQEEIDDGTSFEPPRTPRKDKNGN